MLPLPSVDETTLRGIPSITIACPRLISETLIVCCLESAMSIKGQGSNIMGHIQCELATGHEAKSPPRPTILTNSDGIRFSKTLRLPRILIWRILKVLEKKTLPEDMEFVIEPDKDVFLYIRYRHVGVVYKVNGAHKRYIMQGSEQCIRALLRLLTKD